MQFLNAVLVFASLAVAAPAADAGAAPIAARAPTKPCENMVWNTGEYPGDGGWICYDTPSGPCTEYTWKTDLPYYICF